MDRLGADALVGGSVTWLCGRPGAGYRGARHPGEVPPADAAGAGLRIAPHFYSTDEACDAVIVEIEAVLGDGTWRRHVPSP